MRDRAVVIVFGLGAGKDTVVVFVFVVWNVNLSVMIKVSVTALGSLAAVAARMNRAWRKRANMTFIAIMKEW